MVHFNVGDRVQINQNYRIESVRGQNGTIDQVRGSGWYKVSVVSVDNYESIFSVRSTQLTLVEANPNPPANNPPAPDMLDGFGFSIMLGGPGGAIQMGGNGPPSGLMQAVLGMLGQLNIGSEEAQINQIVQIQQQEQEQMNQQQENAVRASLKKPKENEMKATKMDCIICTNEKNCYTLACCKHKLCIDCWYECNVIGKGQPKCPFCMNPLYDLDIENKKEKMKNEVKSN